MCLQHYRYSYKSTLLLTISEPRSGGFCVSRGGSSVEPVATLSRENTGGGGQREGGRCEVRKVYGKG